MVTVYDCFSNKPRLIVSNLNISYRLFNSILGSFVGVDEKITDKTDDS